MNLSGRYTVDGTNPDGTRYRGKATITVDPSGRRSEMTWRIGSDTYQGVGRISDHEGMMEVRYNGGVAVYSFQPNGVLDGLWGKDLQHLDGKEILYPER
jgi:hypothetical protein